MEPSFYTLSMDGITKQLTERCVCVCVCVCAVSYTHLTLPTRRTV